MAPVLVVLPSPDFDPPTSVSDAHKPVLVQTLDGTSAESAEDARKIYVAASRAQRLLVIAIPDSQARRLYDHLCGTGATVELLQL